jgi:hypothetical protein
MKKQGKSTGWTALIGYAEETLRRTQLRAQQLEAMIAVFRAHSEAGDPCPADLAESVLREQKSQKRLKTA